MKDIERIINTALSSKDCELLQEDYEKRSEVTKEKHLKNFNSLNASFIHFKMLPINQDTLDRIDITQYYKLNNESDHNVTRKYFVSFLGDSQ